MGKLTQANLRVMPLKLEELIQKINGSDNDKITCIIADEFLGWALEVAEKMQIKRAAFWPAAAATLAVGFRIPQLLDDGIIKNDGTPTSNQMIQLSPTMPSISTTHFLWACMGDLTTQEIIFEATELNNTDRYINIHTEIPCFRLSNLGFNRNESGIIKKEEIKEKVEQLLSGKTIKARALDLKEVAAKRVNSTMEGLSNGIPFLCWPYLGDQFLNQSYICDVWKVGLGFNRNESGIIKKEEIKEKVEQLHSDKTIKARALDLKEVAAKSVKEGGCSHNNFNNFIKWLKA
ncbi:hypothetical protein TEA_029448 [Camellia sinensis var. sinensis]|uniref:UDP-glycosyltransferases domain-containing protein n=1 Tax=Camellia sinensis var. sinensis TaxID=542762 RepID=A0A4S4ETS8_CAMSN|nr:hypothetical protein TEA_029448 [Camellia sinensis var. sinensis]